MSVVLFALACLRRNRHSKPDPEVFALRWQEKIFLRLCAARVVHVSGVLESGTSTGGDARDMS